MIYRRFRVNTDRDHSKFIIAGDTAFPKGCEPRHEANLEDRFRADAIRIASELKVNIAWATLTHYDWSPA